MTKPLDTRKRKKTIEALPSTTSVPVLLKPRNKPSDLPVAQQTLREHRPDFATEAFSINGKVSRKPGQQAAQRTHAPGTIEKKKLARGETEYIAQHRMQRKVMLAWSEYKNPRFHRGQRGTEPKGRSPQQAGRFPAGDPGRFCRRERGSFSAVPR
jgi:hypothetical protein